MARTVSFIRKTKYEIMQIKHRLSEAESTRQINLNIDIFSELLLLHTFNNAGNRKYCGHFPE